MAEKCKDSLNTPHAEALSPISSGLPHPLRLTHLKWMCEQVVEHAEEWPKAKLHRWIGFIQCGLMAHRVFDLGEIKAMFNEAKSAYGPVGEDDDLADHLDPTNPFRLDIGGEG
ncbi:MAG: hypothetical protein R3C18_09885 [Planctomycetaceae bacterium]